MHLFFLCLGEDEEKSDGQGGEKKSQSIWSCVQVFRKTEREA